MQAAAAAGPPLVAATPYSSYISYNPQQFAGQPTMMQPMAHYPSQVGQAWPLGCRALACNPGDQGAACAQGSWAGKGGCARGSQAGGSVPGGDGLGGAVCAWGVLC